MTYLYLGDHLTDPRLKGKPCEAVRNSRGKCVRGRLGTMLVRFGAETVNVVGRLLRKQPHTAATGGE